MDTYARFESDPSGPVIRLPAVNTEALLPKADALATAAREFYNDWQEGDFTLSPPAANAATFLNQLAGDYNQTRQG